MATYKLMLPNVDGPKFQQCYDAANGDLHRTFVLLADNALLDPNDLDKSSREDRVICLHLSELCRMDSTISSVVDTDVLITGPSDTLQPLEAAGYLEVQP